LHGFATIPFWLAVAGLAVAYYAYVVNPAWPAAMRQRFSFLVKVLEEKYGFDRFNEWFFAGGSRGVGKLFWKVGDVTIIDGIMVNGTAKLIGWFAGVSRHVQTGFLYTYAFWMILGVFGLLTWVFFRIY
jgi:NADH-quinone oxidoreductase subunit L